MRQSLMARGAAKIINTSLGVKPGEKVLIIAEASKVSIAESLAAATCAADAEPILAVILPREGDGFEPPEPIAAAMYTCDAFICVVEKSITHTNAVNNAKKNGARGVVLTQFSEEMMFKGGIECDFGKVAPECIKLAELLGGAKKVRLTTPFGTDLTFSAEGRRGNALYCIVGPGQFTTLPTIEANVSPLEGTANGKLVADASVPYLGIGVLSEPIVCEVKDGFITSISGGSQAKKLESDLKGRNDHNCFNIAELGVGLNPNCRFCGFMLEDEGVRGSCHIGIGTSITLGGKVKAKCHYDLIMTMATLEVDGMTVLKDGIPCVKY